MDTQLNFQSEKLQLIQMLLNVENPKVIEQVRELLNKTSLPPLTEKELLQRAEESEKAIKDGRVQDLNDFENEVDSWD